MGKAVRLTRRSHLVSIHGTSLYPYAARRVHPRGKPLQRTCVPRPLILACQSLPMLEAAGCQDLVCSARVFAPFYAVRWA